jgi:hypothetical protein
MQNKLPPPPSALVSKNPLQWCRYFGPGAVIASVTIGSGELVFPSRGGSIFGYRLLWVFLLVGFIKWVLAYSSLRHMVISGAHPMERWMSLPGPRGWLHISLLGVLLVTMPMSSAFILGVLGTTATWITGFGDHYIWATLCCLLVSLLLVLGGYGTLEKVQIVMLLVMLSFIVVALIYLRPDWAGVARGFLPQTLSYPDWVYSTLPEMRNRSVWVEVLVYVSVIGGTAPDYLAYTAFVRDKKWGWSHLGCASQEQLENLARARGADLRYWLRAPLVDTALSFFLVVVLSSAFCILGTVVLRPERLIPEGINLLNYQALFLTSLASWLLPLYQVSVFLAFFGTLYAGPEICYRNFRELLRSVPAWRPRIPKRLPGVAYGVFLGGGLGVLWWTRLYPDIELIDIFTPAGILTGVLLSSFYTLTNPWMDWRFLPARLRMPFWLGIANLLAAVVLLIAGLKALWDYGRLEASLGLGLWLAVSMFLARVLRSSFHDGGSCLDVFSKEGKR